MVQCMLNPSVLCLQINSWSGSVEIGVTACDPDCLEFPSSATDLRGGSWVRLSLVMHVLCIDKIIFNSFASVGTVTMHACNWWSYS